MPDFKNRAAELHLICSEDAGLLLNVYGEAGIGKSSLLRAAAGRLRQQSPPRFVAHIDLKELRQTNAADLPRRLLSVLAKALAEMAGNAVAADAGAGSEVSAGEIVRQFQACEAAPVLMFDETQLLQMDDAFWRWLESELTGPLLSTGCVRQVFAGRVPAPWRDYAVRRAVTSLRLTPLAVAPEPPIRHGAARALVLDVLQEHHPALPPARAEALCDLILEFSHGHPGLSEELAQSAGLVDAFANDLQQLRGRMAREVVKPFIEQRLFEHVEPDWRRILWWASVLSWFDITTLRWYLEGIIRMGLEALPCPSADEWDSFFIQGISHLRLEATAVMWETELSGYQLYGVTRAIVRQCLKTLDPDGYRQANRQAAAIIRELANEFAPGEALRERFLGEADAYQCAAEEEAIQ
jgi:hypothetical protein